ncbi:MAG: tetratricopeptide repeat protein [candidate division KSB1 bacterium]|nr:tetratricopeptide repeat protein [candidate division KSB1 bacterium]
MNSSRRTLRASIGSLIVVILGLFLVCAIHREVTTPPVDEDVYNVDLSALLGLQPEPAQPEQETKAKASSEAALATPEAVPQVDKDREELLALLDRMDRLSKQLDARGREISALQSESAQLDSLVSRMGRRLASAGGIGAGRGVSLSSSTTGAPAPGAGPVHVRVSAGAQSSFAGQSFDMGYNEALQLFHERRYREALDRFQELLLEDPSHPLADNCQYWIGECLFGQRRYLEALSAFSKVYMFDATDKYDDAQLMIALCHWHLGDQPTAKLELKGLLKLFPGSEYEGRARTYLGRLTV